MIPRSVFADSLYVLPYPSAMPGSIWYKLDLVKEAIDKFWYWGDFGQFDYNLSESDKYLVEAKTLFEYKQYLLGYNALLKSDSYFRKILPSLTSAKNHDKDISEKQEILKNAVGKHIEVLTQIENEVPASFNWAPEKKPSTNLELKKAIENSIQERHDYE